MVDVITVSSRDVWKETPVWVRPGDTLVLTAHGIWVDAVIPCSADGYPAGLFYTLNRLPRIPDDGRYFRLMGRIVADGIAPRRDDPAATFTIGSHCRRPIVESGRLFVFANDRIGYYWNNWGTISLAIEKYSGETKDKDEGRA